MVRQGYDLQISATRKVFGVVVAKVKSYLHTMQRIAELESFARKLVYSLKLIRGSSQFSHTTWEEITDLANIALIGAKEVLEDEV